MEIRVNLNPLEATITFPYHRRTVAYNNSDWAALYSNLRNSQRRWGMVEKVLGKTGVPIKTWAIIYKLLVQAVLMYGSGIWVVVDATVAVLEGFHHRISIQITGMTEQRGGCG